MLLVAVLVTAGFVGEGVTLLLCDHLLCLALWLA
jgi:hypothetical protein